MKRYKVSDNFYADEFLHPGLYQWAGDLPKKHVNMAVVNICQAAREIVGSPIMINNWWRTAKELGGLTSQNVAEVVRKAPFVDSGCRSLSMPHKIGSRSRHYSNLCADLKFKYNSLEAYKILITDMENRKRLMSLGLTAVEDIEKTRGRDGRNGWLHFSTEYTGVKDLHII